MSGFIGAIESILPAISILIGHFEYKHFKVFKYNWNPGSSSYIIISWPIIPFSFSTFSFV